MEQIIKYLVILIAIGLVYRFASTFLKLPKKKSVEKTDTSMEMIEKSQSTDQQDYSHAYQRKWLLSENEKAAFRKIKPVADEFGVTVYTKVRLFDLIEPKPGLANYKGAMWKIQAKHVDFVFCNQFLDAKLILELDDSSHQRKERQERDQFVDEVLTNTGYTIIHANYINQEQLRQIIKEVVCEQHTANTTREIG